MHGKHEIDWGWSKLTMGGAIWQLVHILLCVFQIRHTLYGGFQEVRHLWVGLCV